MEKMMLAIGKFKEGEGMLEKFMTFFQSDEGMAMRKEVAHVEKTVPGILPDKSGIMFKVHVHNVDVMKQLISGSHPVGKSVYDECVNSMTAWELSKVEM